MKKLIVLAALGFILAALSFGLGTVATVLTVTAHTVIAD
jgi:hypothetical protein